MSPKAAEGVVTGSAPPRENSLAGHLLLRVKNQSAPELLLPKSAGGWPVPSIEYVAASCGPFMAVNDFLERHARPALTRFEAVCAAAAKGAPLPQPFRPEEVT